MTRAQPGQAQLAENISTAMDGQETFFTFGREQKQFDLAGLDEIDHLVLVAAGVKRSCAARTSQRESSLSRAAANRAFAV